MQLADTEEKLANKTDVIAELKNTIAEMRKACDEKERRFKQEYSQLESVNENLKLDVTHLKDRCDELEYLSEV